MKSLVFIITYAIGIALLPVALFAADFGTAEEAKAMLERAVIAVEKDPAKALADFTEGKEGFKKKDLYVFCYDMQSAKINAHGAKASMIGLDVNSLKDKTGAAFGKELFNNSVKGEYREVGYFWPRPGETEPSPKSSFVTRVGDYGCGVGYYK